MSVVIVLRKAVIDFYNSCKAPFPSASAVLWHCRNCLIIIIIKYTCGYIVRIVFCWCVAVQVVLVIHFLDGFKQLLLRQW